MAQDPDDIEPRKPDFAESIGYETGAEAHFDEMEDSRADKQRDRLLDKASEEPFPAVMNITPRDLLMQLHAAVDHGLVDPDLAHRVINCASTEFDPEDVLGDVVDYDQDLDAQ